MEKELSSDEKQCTRPRYAYETDRTYPEYVDMSVREAIEARLCDAEWLLFIRASLMRALRGSHAIVNDATHGHLTKASKGLEFYIRDLADNDAELRDDILWLLEHDSTDDDDRRLAFELRGVQSSSHPYESPKPGHQANPEDPS